MNINSWLSSLGSTYVNNYSKLFLDNGIDFNILKQLSNDDLEEIGVKISIHRIKMLYEIHHLKFNDLNINDLNINDLILSLFDISAIKIKNQIKFTYESPVDIDFKIILSYPDILKLLSTYIHNLCKNKNIQYDKIYGTLYTSLIISSVISVTYSYPILLKPKENHEITKNFKKCLIIHESVESENSLIDTIKSIRNVGYDVNDIVILLDKQIGEDECKFNSHKLNLHSVINTTQVLEVLINSKRIGKTFSKIENNKLSENNDTSLIQNIANWIQSQVKNTGFFKKTKLINFALNSCAIAVNVYGTSNKNDLKKLINKAYEYGIENRLYYESNNIVTIYH